MAKLAKLRKRDSQGLWTDLVRYANEEPNAFEQVVSGGLEWIGGDYPDDLESCSEAPDASYESLEAQYRPDVRRVLTWLSDPVRHKNIAVSAVQFLEKHGTAITLRFIPNTDFHQDRKDPLLYEWPTELRSVLSSVCKFVLDQIKKHDIDREPLRDAIPIGICERPGCGKFFFVERVGRGRFCSGLCRAKDYQAQISKEEKAERMRNYRATIDRHKPKSLVRRRGAT